MKATRPRPAPATPAPAEAPARQDSPVPERRRSARNPHITTATLQPASGDASVDRPVLVCDLSLGGVGLRATHAFKVGSVFRISLGTGPLFLNARIRIVSCRPRPDGMFDVGSAFC